MNEKVPFFLREAVISLFPAGSDGQAVTDAEVWLGGLATELRMELELTGPRICGSGDRFAKTHHTDESHVIEIGKTWMIRRSTPGDFTPERKQQYVLSLVWTEDLVGTSRAVWYRRDYLGVTGRSVRWQSKGTNHFGTAQTFEAQTFQQDQGFLVGAVPGFPPSYLQWPPGTPGGGNPGDPAPSGPPVYTPLAATGELVLIPFFRENVFVVGEYFLGRYRWDRNVTMQSATLMAWPGADTTVVELELDGVLTGYQLVLPGGPPNVEATTSVTLGFAVASGATVRWKIVSGADPADAAWVGSITMGVI